MVQSRNNTNSPTGPSRLYVFGWATLGLIAAVYLSALYARPQWVSMPFERVAGSVRAKMAAGTAAKAKVRLAARRRNPKARKAGKVQKSRGVTARKTVTARKGAKAGAAGRSGGKTVKLKVRKVAAVKIAVPKSPAAAEIAARFAGPGPRAAAARSKAGKPPTRPGARAPSPSAKRVPAPSAKAALSGVRLIGKKVAAGPAKALKSASGKGPPKALKTAKKATKTAALKKVTSAPAPARKITAPTVDAYGGGAKIVTGSLTKPAVIGFGPAVVRRTKQPVFGVEVASGPSLDALRLIWLSLNDRQGDALAKLRPRYRTSGPIGAKRYRLLAGPLKSSAQAKLLCLELRSQQIPCAAATFKGRRL